MGNLKKGGTKMEEMDKVIFVAKSEYDEIVNKLGYVPSNLKVNNFLPDNKAYVVDLNQMNKMFRVNGLTKF